MRALRNFGLGIVWAILSPILLAGILLVALFGIVNFLVQFIIMLVNFFSGKKVFPAYPEEEKAYAILKRAIDQQNGEPAPAPQPPQPQQVYVQQNFYTSTPGQIPGTGQALPPGYQPPFVQIQPGQIPTPIQPGYLPNEVQPTPLPGNTETGTPVPPELLQIPPYDPGDQGGEEE